MREQMDPYALDPLSRYFDFSLHPQILHFQVALLYLSQVLLYLKSHISMEILCIQLSDDV